jgi:peroxiredoxin family protein
MAKAQPKKSKAKAKPKVAKTQPKAKVAKTHPKTVATKPEPIKKVSIIISRGSLEGVYPGLILANGARMEGIEAMVFFTFFGMDAITKKRMNKIKTATVGNPGMHMPTLLGALPGMSAMATSMMKKKMEKLDFPPVDEYIQMARAAGAKFYACKATVEMFGLTKEDFCEEVEDIIDVGTFYQMSAGSQIIFT